MGDSVEIVNLKDHDEYDLHGVIGHVGTIVRISDGWFTLKPYCQGESWLERNLRLVEKKDIFNIWF